MSSKMELIVTFYLHNQKLPKEYLSIFYSFLKTTLIDQNEDKFNELFKNRELKVKNFCFYIKLPNPIFEKDSITLRNNRVEMHIRSSNKVELFEFYNAFLEEFYVKKNYPMNLNQAKLIDVKLKFLKEPISKNNTATWFVKMLSPLVVKKQIDKEKNKIWYYSYEDIEFKDILIENIKNTTKQLGYHFNFNGFELIPVNLRKTIISLYTISFPVTIGSFILKGDTKLLEFLYNSGIGVLRSSGCGSFEILGSE
ncbi:MAG: CRISPR-associated endoribonuclease Cas6 [Bacilli bacterium]|nr:CRISPR-associated endoribonuclease Cas6 [Bacilli bacterium]